MTTFTRKAAGVLPLALACACGLTISACMSNPGPVKQAAAQTLVGTHWRLTQVGNEIVDNPPGEQDAHFVLQSTNLLVSGNAGCNRMFGHYALNGDEIKFDQLGGTRMYCEARMELEQKFLT